MKKRLLLSLCAMLCSVATWALTFSTGQFKYSTTTSSIVKIVGYNSAYSSSQLENLVIPNTVTYNGTTYGVTTISGLGASAFPKTVRVEYGEHDVMIAKEAFMGCSNLTTVELTSCVHQIQADAFKNCSKLKTVYVNKQNALLGSAAIFNSKVTVRIPYSADINAHKASTIFNSSYVTVVHSLGSYDFKNNGCVLIQNGPSSYREVTIVGHVASTTSTSWDIPATVTNNGISYKVVSISPYAVNNSNLTSLRISSPLNSIGAYAFQSNKNLTSVAIQNTVNLVDSYAFNGCTSLTTTNLSGIKKLGENVFYGCTSLKTLNFGNSAMETLDGSLLLGITNLESIEISNSKFKSYNGWLYNSGQTTLLFCPPASTKNGWTKTVTAIGPYAFANSTRTEVRIPYGVKSIYNNAFYCALKLKDLYIPSSVTYLEADRTFFGCAALQGFFINMKSMPSIMSTTFEQSNIKNAYLYVRNGMSSTYKNTTYWKQFKAINDGAYDFAVSSGGYNVINSNTAEAVLLIDANVPASVTDVSGNSYTVTTIADGAAQTGADLITGTLTAPNVTTVGTKAFVGCTKLKAVNLPKATNIGAQAFANCSGLTTVTLPVTMSYIGENAFINCSSLTAFRWPLGVKNIVGATFAGTGLKTFEAPYGVESIGGACFQNCKQLTKVVFPSTVKKIGTYVFMNCDAMQEVVVNSTTPSVSEGYLFGQSTGVGGSSIKRTDAYLRVPVGTVETYKNAQHWGAFKTDNITEGGYDFAIQAKDVALNVVSLPTTDYGIATAVYCPNRKGVATVDLKQLFTDDWGRKFSVTSVAEYCFAGSKASTVILPPGVTKLPAHCFDGAMGIKRFSDIVMAGVTEFGDYAFANSALQGDITIPSKVKALGQGVFTGCKFMKSINTGEVETLKADAFRECVILQTANLPKVTRMGANVFRDCVALNEVALPVTMSTISEACFQGCTELKTMRWPLGVKTIGIRMFSGSGLTSFSAPYGLQKIDGAAFAGSVSLHDLLLPSTVTEISEYAFKDCERLVNIYVNAPTPPTISKYAFGEKSSGVTLGIPVKSVAWLRVPKASVDTYKAAELWGGKNALFEKESITEGAYDFYVRAASGTDEHFDVKSWDESSNSGEVIWTGRRRDTQRFDVDCSTPRWDEWGRKFAITEIADEAFANDGIIGTFKLGTVKKVGKSAFRNAQFAGDIELTQADKGEVEIGTYAFADTKGSARVIIEGPASNNYQTNIKLGQSCFGDKPSIRIFVPSKQYKDYLLKVAWSPELLEKYAEHLCIIWRPENIIDGEFTSENFPRSVSLRGTGLEAIVTTLDNGTLHKYNVTEVPGNAYVILYQKSVDGEWQERYLLKEPYELPSFQGTIINAQPIDDQGTPRSASQEGYDIYVYDKEQNKYVKSTDDNPQDADKSYYVELPKGYDAVLVPLEENLTGIRDVEATGRAADGRLYNLRGQRVDRPTKPGLYIINGKKVVIK